MREWLRGGASPCQGEGRGFESRLALFSMPRKCRIYAVFRVFYFPDFVAPLLHLLHLLGQMLLRQMLPFLLHCHFCACLLPKLGNQ